MSVDNDEDGNEESKTKESEPKKEVWLEVKTDQPNQDLYISSQEHHRVKKLRNIDIAYIGGRAV